MWVRSTEVRNLRLNGSPASSSHRLLRSAPTKAIDECRSGGRIELW
jgi:hypothetical protein